MKYNTEYKNTSEEKPSHTKDAYLYVFKHNQWMEGAEVQYRMKWKKNVKIITKAGRKMLSSLIFFFLPLYFSTSVWE